MSAVEKTLDPEKLRAALAGFWNDALEIKAHRQGVTLALPQTSADGWQIVVEITALAPGKVRLGDSGRTLGALASAGQNIEADSVSERIDRVLRQSHVERDGFELFRWSSLPIDPVDVHVFAEALVAISHLWVLHEPMVRTQNIADITLQRVFKDRQLTARSPATLTGKTEANIRVDYLVETKRPVAFEILRRRMRLLAVMEQWGYRWEDIRKVNPALMPVMLYDPAAQEIDDTSRAIGENVCTLFCAYNETDRIHDVLQQAEAA